MRNGSLKYRHCSAEDLVQEQQRFDMVCSMEVIEHVDNPADFLCSLAELVKVRFTLRAAIVVGGLSLNLF